MDPATWKPLPADIVILQQSCWHEDPMGAKDVFAADVVTTMNVDADIIPMGGEIVGRDGLMAKVLQFREVFEILEYQPRICGVDGNIVRSRVNMLLRHRRSGEIVLCKKRSVYEVRDNLIVRVDEYVDRAMMETFIRLVRALQV